MKKAIIVIMVLCAMGGAGFFAYQKLSIPKSKKILAEMKRISNSSESDMMKVFEINNLWMELASAYVDEGKYNMALDIYEQQINHLREEARLNAAVYHQKRHSTSYALEAAYFDSMASLYDQEKIPEKAAKAREKASQARQMRDKVALHEPKQKSVLDR